MKRIIAFLIISILILSLSACANNVSKPATIQNASSNEGLAQNNSAKIITREEALEIALKEAGLKQADIYDIDVEFDKEFGTGVWEVDFESGNLEYSYDINAQTGAIIKAEKDREY